MAYLAQWVHHKQGPGEPDDDAAAAGRGTGGVGPVVGVGVTVEAGAVRQACPHDPSLPRVDRSDHRVLASSLDERSSRKPDSPTRRPDRTSGPRRGSLDLRAMRVSRRLTG